MLCGLVIARVTLNLCSDTVCGISQAAWFRVTLASPDAMLDSSLVAADVKLGCLEQVGILNDEFTVNNSMGFGRVEPGLDLSVSKLLSYVQRAIFQKFHSRAGTRLDFFIGRKTDVATHTKQGDDLRTVLTTVTGVLLQVPSVMRRVYCGVVEFGVSSILFFSFVFTAGAPLASAECGCYSVRCACVFLHDFNIVLNYMYIAWRLVCVCVCFVLYGA